MDDESDVEAIYDEDPSDEDEDSGNESSEHGGEAMGLLDEPSSVKERMEIEEDFPFLALTTEQILKDMTDCIREVNMIVQLPPTVTRILLNHFRWDKEKLYER